MGIYVSMTKPPKIFRLKIRKNPMLLGIRQIIFQRQIGQKYFVQNGRRQEKTRDFDYMVFGHFKNVHFALCAPSILKHEIQTPKNGVVTIMLSKRIFDPKKL